MQYGYLWVWLSLHYLCDTLYILDIITSFHTINKSLKKKVITWHHHLQINKKLTNENQILEKLLEKMRVEMAASVHTSILSKVQIFQNCEKGLLEELVLKLKPQVYSPEEYVCKKGDIGQEIYINKDRKLAVVADDGITQFAVFGEGNYFGEISILNIKDQARQLLADLESSAVKLLQRKTSLWEEPTHP
uniref:Cyclic nucleotide-binding domain-containing protein n=1 Tax=Pyxicephalus adspersus TaxID=30357 RepID=A0AAV3B953_PYXAD|nr:TPA: hypothetical protein GDO54_000982 [Pyxicephalus adspersus]